MLTLGIIQVNLDLVSARPQAFAENAITWAGKVQVRSLCGRLIWFGLELRTRFSLRYYTVRLLAMDRSINNTRRG